MGYRRPHRARAAWVRGWNPAHQRCCEHRNRRRLRQRRQRARSAQGEVGPRLTSSKKAKAILSRLECGRHLLDVRTQGGAVEAHMHVPGARVLAGPARVRARNRHLTLVAWSQTFHPVCEPSLATCEPSFAIGKSPAPLIKLQTPPSSSRILPEPTKQADEGSRSAPGGCAAGNEASQLQKRASKWPTEKGVPVPKLRGRFWSSWALSLQRVGGPRQAVGYEPVPSPSPTDWVIPAHANAGIQDHRRGVLRQPRKRAAAGSTGRSLRIQSRPRRRLRRGQRQRASATATARATEGYGHGNAQKEPLKRNRCTPNRRTDSSPA